MINVTGLLLQVCRLQRPSAGRWKPDGVGVPRVRHRWWAPPVRVDGL